MKYKLSIIVPPLFLVISLSLAAQKAPVHSATWSAQVNGKTIFKVAAPDLKLSPYTGMTRTHWKNAAQYLLEGAFNYIHDLKDPMKFPKQPGKSYPRYDGQIPTEKLEGLCRTLFMAVPLLKDNPTLQINHIKVADYYRYQVRILIDSTSPAFIKHRAPNGGPSQNLVEFGALAVSMFAIPEVIWDPLMQTEKDALAATMLSYGDGPTVPSNWKFFNIFVLSFFKEKGYTVNEKLLEQYLQQSLDHYQGNGWYNDNPAYDYYSMWAFQMYGTLWSEYFGKKHYPAYAKKFLENFKAVKDNYPYMFSRNGQMIMWGRSMTYRFGAIVPFPLMGFENNPDVNYGWMRRISSGVLLQFLQHPDFLQDGVPTLGFYGAFEPAVQGYSCRGSAFWMGKAFLGLLVPAGSPFWTATENEGPWAKEMVKGKVYNKFQDSSKILITDYPGIGASEIRAWCNVKLIGASEPFRSSENYNRLSYNSAFPWQADSTKGVVAMNYIFKNKKSEWEPLRLFEFTKFSDGIYYRNTVLETNENIHLNLADIPLPDGILRIDRNTSTEAIALRLGHYALPQLKGKIKEEKRKVKGYEIQIISNGVYQLAMIPLKGWDEMKTINTSGVHPESNNSAVMNVSASFLPQQNKEPVIYATLMLWKKAGEKWTADELVPVRELKINGGQVKVIFNNKDIKTVDFE